MNRFRQTHLKKIVCFLGVTSLIGLISYEMGNREIVASAESASVGKMSKKVNPNSNSNQLLYCTLRLEVQLSSDTVRRGTGLVFRYTLPDGDSAAAIITNKHVVKDGKSIKFYLHKFDAAKNGPSGGILTVVVDDFLKRWVAHPDPKVDLGMIGIGSLTDQLSDMSQTPFLVSLSPETIPTDEELMELNAIEKIVMVGYPDGLFDSVNNYPIIRTGTTATHPAIDFDGRPEFVVDIAVFGGSSGSPVFLFDDGFYTTKGVIRNGPRLLLLGILWAGPVYSADGQVVAREIPTTPGEKTKTTTMMNLGYVIKASEIQVLIDVVNQKAK